jgi:hypothetical protein
MNCCENEYTQLGKRDYRGVVTSQYRKYFVPSPVGLQGISDGLVMNRGRWRFHFRDNSKGINGLMNYLTSFN